MSMVNKVIDLSATATRRLSMLAIDRRDGMMRALPRREGGDSSPSKQPRTHGTN